MDEPKRLENFPFIFMTGEAYFRLSESEEKNLKEYIENGGFIFMEDCGSRRAACFFYKSSCKHLENMFSKGSIPRFPRFPGFS